MHLAHIHSGILFSCKGEKKEIMKFSGQCIRLEKIIREEPQAQKQNALCAF